MNAPVRLLILFVLAAAVMSGCQTNEVVEPATPVQIIKIADGDYATNHYWVDTSYISLYEHYYQNRVPGDPRFFTDQVVEMQVWVQYQSVRHDPNERVATAYIGLPPKPGGSPYDLSFRNVAPPDSSPGRISTQRFVRLDPTLYEIDQQGYTGILSLNSDVADGLVVAVAYRRADGIQYGELTRDRSDTLGNLVLKMVKPQYLIVRGGYGDYMEAWDMLVKSIYHIPTMGGNLTAEGFRLDIFRANPGGADRNTILGTPLLQIFGLDRYSGRDLQQATPDGMFDFIPGVTVNLDRDEAIFPDVRPFDQGIMDYFRSHGLPAPGAPYLRPTIYDTTQNFSGLDATNGYYIRATLKP